MPDPILSSLMVTRILGSGLPSVKTAPNLTRFPVKLCAMTAVTVVNFILQQTVILRSFKLLEKRSMLGLMIFSMVIPTRLNSSSSEAPKQFKTKFDNHIHLL